MTITTCSTSLLVVGYHQLHSAGKHTFNATRTLEVYDVSDIRLVDTLIDQHTSPDGGGRTYHPKSNSGDDTRYSSTRPRFQDLFFLNVRHFRMVQFRCDPILPQGSMNEFTLPISLLSASFLDTTT